MKNISAFSVSLSKLCQEPGGQEEYQFFHYECTIIKAITDNILKGKKLKSRNLIKQL